MVPLESPLTQAPLIEKSPIAVDIIYSEDLQNHKCIIGNGYIAETWTIALGPPSIDMFNLIFNALFEKVLVVGNNADTLASDGPKSIIEVGLLMLDGCNASWPIVGASIGVAYEATLRNSEGVEIARWKGQGKAGPDDYIERYAGAASAIEVEIHYLTAVTSIAMRKAAADFIINFDKNPRIRSWLGK